MGEKLKKFGKVNFWMSQGISLAGIVDDLGFQERIREKVNLGETTLNPVSHFINEHFVGDIGNAYAAVFLPSIVVEFINLDIQKNENIDIWKKDISRFIAVISPYLMAALFLGIAYNVEMSSNILQAGTGDSLDFIGALWGTATALPAAVKFNNAVFRS